MVNWKRNLAIVWLGQFLSIMGFWFGLPFASYYIQELGITDPVALKMWAAIFTAATPLAFVVLSPVWGCG